MTAELASIATILSFTIPGRIRRIRTFTQFGTSYAPIRFADPSGSVCHIVPVTAMVWRKFDEQRDSLADHLFDLFELLVIGRAA